MSTHYMLFFIFMSTIHANSTPKPIRFITNMTYHNSLHSPIFNSNKTLKEYAIDESKISNERLAYFKMFVQNNFSSEKIMSELIPGGPPRIFFVHFYVGVPATPQLLVMDTGSSVPWIMCRPVADIEVPNLYDPKKSQTYAQNVRCDSSYCIDSGHDNQQCGPLGECNYKVQYLSGWTLGKLASERFERFQATIDGESLAMVFGCSLSGHIQNNLLQQCNAILGLGPRNISIVKQSSFNKFSYCIGNLDTSTTNYHKLVIGEPLFGSVPRAPLIIDEYDHYYVNLIGIRFGEKLLDIDEEKLKKNQYTGGALIDTGSTVSYIQSVAYEKLEDEIITWLSSRGFLRSTGEVGGYEICFEGNLRSTKLNDFPVVTLIFDEGAKMKLSLDALFLQMDSVYFCLTIQNAEERFPSSLIGVRLQQFFYIAYDLDQMTVSFRKVDCEFL